MNTPTFASLPNVADTTFDANLGDAIVVNKNLKKTPVLHPICERYLTTLHTQRSYSDNTINSYRLDLVALSALLNKALPEQITSKQIRTLASQMRLQNLKPRTIARHLSCWRSFFKWYALNHDLPYNPVIGVKPPKREKSIPKALSVDDAVHLVSQELGNEPALLADKAMFELLYSSGLRVSELVSIDVAYAKTSTHQSTSWIDLSEEYVHVLGKGKKVREVPVGKDAIIAIKNWLAVRMSLVKLDPHALFLTSRGTRMSVRLVQMRLKAFGQKSAVQSHVHPHVLRHSFASHILQSSGDLRAVQELLGHASLSSTQVYTALDFQHLAKTYDAAHPRAKLKK